MIVCRTYSSVILCERISLTVSPPFFTSLTPFTFNDHIRSVAALTWLLPCPKPWDCWLE